MGLFDLFTSKAELRAENERLRARCDVKDIFFAELAADALRHGSSLGGKHLADKRWHDKRK